jgi:hypothetical protein
MTIKQDGYEGGEFSCKTTESKLTTLIHSTNKKNIPSHIDAKERDTHGMKSALLYSMPMHKKPRCS